jgi:hypothetical protein
VPIDPISASFRDPSGYLFQQDGLIYRMVSNAYSTDYDMLMNSGLYESLVSKGWLLAHEELPTSDFEVTDCYRVLLPEQLTYVSYPYEWCFSLLKDAALLTLNIQLEALKHGMTLKDASAYNVQMHNGKAVFIDTLSFEEYREGAPWIAYRQYCQHFLAPLALICKRDFRTLHLLRAYIDGVPLDLASSLLPRTSWLNYGLLAHVHLHALSQKRYQDEGRSNASAAKVRVSRLQFQGVIESLLSATRKLDWKYAQTEWGSYYDDTNYVDDSMTFKEQAVSQFLQRSLVQGESQLAADFGANTGRFSRLAVTQGYHVLSHDIDEVVVDRNYRQMTAEGETTLIPLLLDLTNPSPGLGWANNERTAFLDRREVDVGMALALIHHIAISNNVPLTRIAAMFHKICRSLIIEFVPKSDSQVRRLLATREDIFPHYTEEGFEAAFSGFFDIADSVSIEGSERTLYLMKRRGE